MKRVLIITYYWPPSGGSAVLRWLKFSKYLREFGWEPVIYTPSNPEPQEIDESLVNDVPENIEVIKTTIYEPYGIYKWVTGKKQNERLGVALMSEKKKHGFISKFSLWIRSNFFIPDPRFLWVKPSVNFLISYIKKYPVEVVITTGPPHSMHLIGLGIKRKINIRWIADFRDPWTNIDFYKELLLTRLADKYHRRLEKNVLLNADQIITVSPGMTKEFQILGVENVVTITNGYDEEVADTHQSLCPKFTITHLGSLPKARNPENLWKVLSTLINQNPGFASKIEIKLIGKADGTIQDSLHKHNLMDYVVWQSFVPHKETIQILKGSAVLLLCVNNTSNAKGILTNKFFEYLSAQKPILAIGPEDGDIAYILNETGSGKIFNFTEFESLYKHVVTLFELYSQHILSVNSSNISKYSRKNLTRQLSELLNK